MILSVELSFLERTGVQSCSFRRIFSLRIDIQSSLVENCVLLLVQNYLWVQMQFYGDNYDLGANSDVPVCWVSFTGMNWCSNLFFQQNLLILL